MRLEDFSIWQRILIAAGIVLVVFLILLGITRWMGEVEAAAQQEQQGIDLYADIPYDPELLAIDKVALKEAYHDQLKFLFSVWLKDGGRNVKGATTGLKNARSAYGYAAAQIAKREQQLPK